MSELNPAIDDARIEDIIAQHDDTDHPDATTVERVRDLLGAIQEAAVEGWWEYIDNVERGDWRVVAETADLIVFDTGEYRVFDQEIELHPDVDYRDDEGIESGIVSQVMHELAGDLDDRRWPATYPMVVAKPDGVEDGQRYTEAIINGLMARGLSPGQAWAYYGVEVRGNSRNQWATRCGYSDHSAVSEPVRKAKQKL